MGADFCGKVMASSGLSSTSQLKIFFLRFMEDPFFSILASKGNVKRHYRPFNETRAIAHERAGTRPAQFTRSICRSRQLYEKYTFPCARLGARV